MSGDRPSSPSASTLEAVGLRLETLSPACLTLLGRAAVIGRTFNSRVLAEAIDVTYEIQLELLGEALALTSARPLRVRAFEGVNKGALAAA